jgi:hypothetical protein
MKVEEIYIESINKTVTYYIGKNAKDNFKVIDITLAKVYLDFRPCFSLDAEDEEHYEEKNHHHEESN